MYTWKLPCDRLGILSISSILPQILPQTSSQTQGNLEHLECSYQPHIQGRGAKKRTQETREFPEWSTKHPLFSLEISGNAK